jgi:uncharacterized alkaline shock family protein YloU
MIMAENRKIIQIKSDSQGEIKIAEEVVAIVAALAATEVDGVSSMAGNITNEIVSKLGMRNLSKGIEIEVENDEIKVSVAINIGYGYNIPDVSAKVQDKISTAIENMTGLHVSEVNVKIASVDMGSQS